MFLILFENFRTKYGKVNWLAHLKKFLFEILDHGIGKN